MRDPWPPPIPGAKKAFKKAHDATNDNLVPKGDSPVVSKMQIRELERQRKKPSPQLNLLPSQIKLNIEEDKKRERDIQRMRARLKQSKDKARDSFEQTL